MVVNPHILVIDPAVHTPELDSFNHLVSMSPLPMTYHLPAMHGMESFEALTPSAISSMRGIIILGSQSSVNERTPWQKSLETWLMPHLTRKVPTFGICYGHQMLAHMFGGRIDYVKPDRYKYQELREVTFQAGSVFGRARADLKGPLVFSHNECVAEAPAEMKISGSSPVISCEALSHKTLPIFSVQAHPEATPLLLKHFSMESHETLEHLDFGRRLLTRFFTFIGSQTH